MGFSGNAPEKKVVSKTYSFKPFTAVDIKTATQYGSICSLSIAKVSKNGTITDTKNWLVKPPNNRYDDASMQMYNVNPELTKDAPSIIEILPEILPYFENKYVAAHYAPFHCEQIAALKSNFNIKGVYCSRAVARYKLPQLPDYKLPTICKELDIELDYFDLISHAVACAKIMINLNPYINHILSWDQARDKEHYKNYFNSTM